MKVHEKVKVIKNNGDPSVNYYVGEVGYIEDISDSGNYSVRIPKYNNIIGCSEDEIMVLPRKFKIKEKVKVIKNNDDPDVDYYIGDVGYIEENTLENYLMYMMAKKYKNGLGAGVITTMPIDDSEDYYSVRMIKYDHVIYCTEDEIISMRRKPKLDRVLHDN